MMSRGLTRNIKPIIMTGLKLSVGLISGYLTLPLVYKMLPVNMKTAQNRQWLGLVNVAVGALLFTFIRQKAVKDVALVIAGTGVYDLIAANIPQLGLPKIPEENLLINSMIPGAAPAAVSASYGVPRLPVSRSASMLGASAYQKAQLGASYADPTMQTAGFHGDNPFEGVEGYQPSAY